MNNIYKCRGHILFSVILRCLTAFLTTVLLAGGAASAGYAQEPVPDGIKGLRETWEKHKGGEEPETEAGPQYNTSKQTTEEDILRMNHGDATLLYSEEGYLTFLRGKYCEEKVLNPEDGIATLSPMATLLGLSRGSEFFAVFGQTNRFGYTYFTYQQRYGDITIENAVLKIIVDPEGYTAGLISSFTPNIGIAPENEQAISKEEAGEITRTFWAGENLHIFEEYTRQTSVTIGSVAYHAWAVFTDVPSSYAGNDDRHYLENLVAYDGSYLMYVPVDTPEELVLGDDAQAELAFAWFDGKEADTWTGTVTLHDGTQEEITVPVAKDGDGNWYLADLERHILLADCYSFTYEYTVDPITSGENGGWPEHYLIVYDRMIRVYDFFAQYGYLSTDGFGTPILLMTDYCDGQRRSVDNACFMGYAAGWSTFGFSESNNFGESIDVVGHEFTHGITRYSVAGHCSINEAGAINEGLSDILGNLCEMLMEASEDDTWLMGETCGQIVRSLSFPWRCGQPVRVGGRYYIDTSGEPTMANDYGGVHTNCSMITYPAWLLSGLGMDPEEELLLWLETINLLTPECRFCDVHHALVLAAKMRGMDEQWVKKIDMVFEQVGVD